MKKFGISSPDELDDDKKKEFFNYVDKNYQQKTRKTRGNLIFVKVHNNNVSMPCKFKKKVKESKLMLELREREYYKKPSLLKKRINRIRMIKKKKVLKISYFFNICIFIYTKNTLRFFNHHVM